MNADSIKKAGEVVQNLMKDLDKSKQEAILSGANATIPEAIPSVNVTGGTVKLTPYITLPNETLAIQQQIFGTHTIPKKELQLTFREGQEVYSYETRGEKADISYYLPKEIVEGEMPSLASMETAYKHSLKMALEQCSEVIEFTLGEKLSLMGYSKDRIDRGGKIFQHLDRTERALAGTTIHYKSKGNRPTEKIGSLCTLEKQQGQGKGLVYKVWVNPAFTQGINFATGELSKPFTKMPLNLIGNRSMPHYEKNLRTKLQVFIGLKELAPYGSTLLEWSGLPKSLRKRKAVRDRIYSQAVNILSEMGFRKKKIDYNGHPADFRKWRLYYAPPQNKASRRIEFSTLDSTTKEFIEQFINWQLNPAHYGKQGCKLTREQIRDRIVNTIRGYGLTNCQRIFNDIQRTAEPYPKAFWDKIKKLKAQRLLSDSGKTDV